jgi:hypothetical protein
VSLRQKLSYHTSWMPRRDSAWATHVLSAEALAWKMCTRVRWALIISFTAL